MDKLLFRIASVLAFIIGAMAIVAGGQVLLGRDPGYYVINWLPLYNFILGVFSVAVTAILIWRRSGYALPAALATFSAHATVMIILQTAYRPVVASDSLRAMTIRLAIWLVILVLMYFGLRKKQGAAV